MIATERVLLVTVFVLGVASSAASKKEWWQNTIVYEIWIPSFKDSDGDGIGDLNGVTSKLEHFVDMGVETIWLPPFFTSPMADTGYDISNYRDINPIYGTLKDFDNLVARAKKLGLKIVLDFVPNHTSDEHVWFNYSKASIEPYTDYYVWKEGYVDSNGVRHPPNNWLSVFNGSSWEWVEERKAYYLHQFLAKQPDLNLTNPLVLQETKDILTFWLDRGVDGFRLDAVPYLVEHASFADQLLSGKEGYVANQFFYLESNYVKDQPENFELVKMWRKHLDNYTKTVNDGVTRIILTEAFSNISTVAKYYDYGSQVPFNFLLIASLDGVYEAGAKSAAFIKERIGVWMDYMPKNATANWGIGNHDNTRCATRYGIARVDALNYILLLLPGLAVTYNGEEIGMINTKITGGNFRDPVRTPYQWDNTTCAGFSTNCTTRLPVNENYRTLNLAAQKAANVSHYKNYQALTQLRKLTVVRDGDLNVQVIRKNVLAFTRELDGHEPIVVVVNWENSTITVSLEVFKNIPDNLKVLVADIYSGVKVRSVFSKSSITLPPNAAVVLTTSSGYDSRTSGDRLPMKRPERPYRAPGGKGPVKSRRKKNDIKS